MCRPHSAGGNATAPIDEQITVSGPTTIRLQAMRSDALGAASIAQICSDGVSAGSGTVLQEFVLAGPALLDIGSGGLSADADVTAALAEKQVAAYEAAAR